jgi:hypothetical protein
MHPQGRKAVDNMPGTPGNNRNRPRHAEETSFFFNVHSGLGSMTFFKKKPGSRPLQPFGGPAGARRPIKASIPHGLLGPWRGLLSSRLVDQVGHPHVVDQGLVRQLGLDDLTTPGANLVAPFQMERRLADSAGLAAPCLLAVHVENVLFRRPPDAPALAGRCCGKLVVDRLLGKGPRTRQERGGTTRRESPS